MVEFDVRVLNSANCHKLTLIQPPGMGSITCTDNGMKAVCVISVNLFCRELPCMEMKRSRADVQVGLSFKWAAK